MERVIAQARETTEASERETVAAEVDRLVRESGLSRAQFASRIRTSPSRLSTYATGKVTPSAALLVRMRHVAEREQAGRELLEMPPPPGPSPEPDWEEQKREMLDEWARKLEAP
jgi:transcriptional regulator with XRE-family HTH domain